MFDRLKSWKSTLAGIGSIIGGIVLIIDGKYIEGCGLIGTGIMGILAKESK